MNVGSVFGLPSKVRERSGSIPLLGQIASAQVPSVAATHDLAGVGRWIVVATPVVLRPTVRELVEELRVIGAGLGQLKVSSLEQAQTKLAGPSQSPAHGLVRVVGDVPVA